MAEKLDHVTEESIKLLVDRFYDKIQQDPNLSPIFERAIGKKNKDWQPHLDRMYDFWSSIMLTSGRYHGNPMQKHKDLPAFDLSLFERWLELFVETAKEIHTDDITAQYQVKSGNIAKSLTFALTPNHGLIG